MPMGKKGEPRDCVHPPQPAIYPVILGTPLFPVKMRVFPLYSDPTSDAASALERVHLHPRDRRGYSPYRERLCLQSLYHVYSRSTAR